MPVILSVAFVLIAKAGAHGISNYAVPYSTVSLVGKASGNYIPQNP